MEASIEVIDDLPLPSTIWIINQYSKYDIALFSNFVTIVDSIFVCVVVIMDIIFM
jgi:hypothetical protein